MLGLGNIGIYCHGICIMAKSITVLLYITIFYFFLSQANYTIECIIPVDTFITNTLQEVYNIFIILLSNPLL